ncbi:antirestriction protein [Vitreoscilla stercoraria]|uniref:Antirestriction protein n=1 Tax=Vitreoscilla stercoraria TaxID=61 RepID=A0ABY4EEI2_VITST|nr:antirestriction protein [Vitreoscilla stercoraria]UOO93749.1 antirestriction protein [Vitreoscilla stercoraria]
MTPEYTGGYWSFHHLSNKGCLSVLERDEGSTLLLVSPNGFNARMGVFSASIVVNLMVLSDLSFATHQNPRLCAQVSHLFHALRDYALEQPNASETLAAID